jgi:hypothetical protein
MPRWVNGSDRITLHKSEGPVNAGDHITLRKRGGFAIAATSRRMYHPCHLISPDTILDYLLRTTRKACQIDSPSLHSR